MVFEMLCLDIVKGIKQLVLDFEEMVFGHFALADELGK